MRRVARSGILACSAAVIIAAALGAYAIQVHRAPRVAPGAIAVLELFTSEGCSSCPPADDLLAQFAKNAREQHSRVYPLEFHVDSWNQSDWADPFSAAEYTHRQEAYIKAGVSDEFYTPQMVVNGRKTGLGSDGPAIHALVDEALQKPATVDLVMTVQHIGDDLVATVDLSMLPPAGFLNVALVERGILSSVPKGENAGRRLSHENVVRAYKTVQIAQTHASLKLAIPHGVVTGNCSVIAYVQNERLAVLGATDASVPVTSVPAALVSAAASQP
jgi:hypothetical protein